MKKFKYIFGPVPSRRLGMSLGVDIVPMKTCTFDCVYCQIGRTPEKRIRRGSFVPVDAVVREIRQVLNSGTPVDYVTISGSGEPTLNRDIGTLIRKIHRIPGAKTAVITNASLLYRADVRKDLLESDAVLPSLDFGTERALQRVNRPVDGLSARQIFEGLSAFRNDYTGRLWLEVFLVNGMNTGTRELASLRKKALALCPDRIDLNTAVRPPREKFVTPLTQADMERIREYFGPPAEIAAGFKRSGEAPVRQVDADRVVASLERRPQTAADLCTALGADRKELDALLERLLGDKKITARRHGDVVYYEST